MVIGTAFGIGYLHPLLRGSNDAVTASTIRSSIALFHAGIAGTAVGMVAMPLLAGSLYEREPPRDLRRLVYWSPAPMAGVS